MNICLIAVCHNTYQQTLKYLFSLDKAIRNTGISLDVFLVDNSIEVEIDMVNKIKSLIVDFRIHYVASENLGYFPSVIAAIKSQKIELVSYNFLMISNVDLTVSIDFFSEIKMLPMDETIGSYAPSIVSKKMNHDQNPKITIRPSRFKLKFNRFLFRSRFTYWFLTRANKLRLKLREIRKLPNLSSSSSEDRDKRKIYASHGSFFILTHMFLKKVSELNYPVFLFGEEIYIAETSRNLNLDIIYVPNLLVFDSEHASTSKMEIDTYRSYNEKALTYLLEKFKF